MAKEFLIEAGGKIPYDVGVCQHHCCREHGCKYGKPDCAVKLGEIDQLYPCEICDEPDITIPKKLYDELVRDARFLSLLESYGVDNWEGWDDCVRMMVDD